MARKRSRANTRMDRVWDAAVAPDDLVLIPGDISWASIARRVREDLQWLAARPGNKAAGRGDRDQYKWQDDLPAGITFLEDFGVFAGVAVVMLRFVLSGQSGLE